MSVKTWQNCQAIASNVLNICSHWPHHSHNIIMHNCRRYPRILQDSLSIRLTHMVTQANVNLCSQIYVAHYWFNKCIKASSSARLVKHLERCGCKSGQIILSKPNLMQLQLCGWLHETTAIATAWQTIIRIIRQLSKSAFITQQLDVIYSPFPPVACRVF